MAEFVKKEKASKPLILEINEAKEETVAAVNDIIRRHRLPVYFMEGIIADIYRQVAAGAQRELSAAKEQAARSADDVNKDNE
ncbi:MAG: hypothetical protein LUD27_00680 [Clostridia bacterium]|nr:hypothetical protein [Clostridia bacterium]